MSIPGPASRTAAPSSEPNPTAGTGNKSSATGTPTAEMAPVMKIGARSKAREELRAIYLDAYESHRNAYTDSLILGKNTDSDASKVDRKDLGKTTVDLRKPKAEGIKRDFVFTLIRKKAFDALQMLLENGARVSGDCQDITYVMDFSDMNERDINDLAEALNHAPHPLPLKLQFGSRKEETKKINQFLFGCKQIASLDLKISAEGVQIIDAIKGNRKITILAFDGVARKQKTPDQPEKSPLIDYCKLLESMPQLESFSFGYNMQMYPQFTSKILQSLKYPTALKALHVFFGTMTIDNVNHLIELVQASRYLSDLTMDCSEDEGDLDPSHRVALYEAIANSRSLQSVECRNIRYLRKNSDLIKSIFSNSGITHLALTDFDERTNYIDAEHKELIQIVTLLAENCRIVQVFRPESEYALRQRLADSSRWLPYGFHDVNRNHLSEIFELLDKNRALADQALIEEYGLSFTPYDTGDGAKAPLVGPAYLDPDTAKLLTKQILYLSPDVENFKDTMNEIHLSVRAAAMQQADQEAAGIFDTSNGSVKSTKDVTTLLTTTSTTTPASPVAYGIKAPGSTSLAKRSDLQNIDDRDLSEIVSDPSSDEIISSTSESDSDEIINSTSEPASDNEDDG